MQTSKRQFIRVAIRKGPPVTFSFEGKILQATAGDSVLAALLENGVIVRRLEFGGEPRAGFCLMGSCQDCWVWSSEGGRIRTCTTEVADGMAMFAEPQPMAADDG
jgi:predicted molibdopterin-dependent oxidoreductase YjgC